MSHTHNTFIKASKIKREREKLVSSFFSFFPLLLFYIKYLKSSPLYDNSDFIFCKDFSSFSILFLENLRINIIRHFRAFDHQHTIFNRFNCTRLPASISSIFYFDYILKKSDLQLKMMHRVIRRSPR